jgi:hypothetical protein
MNNLSETVNALKLYNEILLNHGVSYNINTGHFNPDYGYMVSIPGATEKVAKIDEDVVKWYIAKHSVELAKPDAFFGCWFDGEQYVLDVSIHAEKQRDAIFYGIMWEQRAIWDCKNRDEIFVKRKENHIPISENPEEESPSISEPRHRCM